MNDYNENILNFSYLNHMNPTTLFISIIAGAIGTGYFIYGKRESLAMMMLSGAGLCVYPYFTDNIAALCIIGAILMTIPYFLRF